MYRLLFFFAAAMAGAETLSLPMEALPGRVSTHHYGLRVARAAIEEAKARLEGAGRLPNPRAGVDWRPQSRLNPGTAVFSVEQAFPVTRRLSLEKKLGAQQVAAAVLEVRDVERRLIAEARTMAVQLLALEARRALAVEQVKLSEAVAAAAGKRAEKGEGAGTDAAQAELDAVRAALEVSRLEGEMTVQSERLKPAVGVGPADRLVLAGRLGEPVAVAEGGAWVGRPDYQLARARSDAAATSVALAKARKWDDWSAGLTGGPEYQRINGDAQTTGFAGVRLSVPLPFWNRNEGEIAAAGAQALRAREELAALGVEIAAEAATARREMETLAATAGRLTRTLLPAAAEQTAKLEKSWQAGEVPFAVFLRAREQQLEMQAMGLDLRRDYHLARIRFEAATAIPRP
jgi:cobalt-zinc-cadmium efflux system outer membrane protein